MLQQIIDWVDDGVGQVISLCLGLDRCRVFPLDEKWRQLSRDTASGLAHPALTTLTRSLTTIGPALMPALDVDGWGVQLFPTYTTTIHCQCIQFYHAHKFWDFLPKPMSKVLSLLCCPDMELGLISLVLQLVHLRDTSPTLVTSGSTVTPATGIDGWGRGRAFLPSSWLVYKHHCFRILF